MAARRARASRIVAALEEAYPRSTCALRHGSPFQLLVATILSAQTTDLVVNQVTPALFARWPTPAALAAADEAHVGAVIQAIGLWRSKARNLVAAARMLVTDFGGDVPRTVGGLVRLPGVGRKTATAVLGTAYGIAAGVTVDTHMLRIHRLLGLSRASSADRMTRELEQIVPRAAWTTYTHRIIDHGRLVCVARRPRCGVCVLAQRGLCPSAMDPAAGYRAANDATEPASARGLSWRDLPA
jgi:endonuclease-3